MSVHDANHAPVDGAEVTGDWNAATGSGTSGCTTDPNGTCSVSYAGVRKKTGSVQYGVSGIANFAYDGAANHDPDADSDGTTINVSKP